MSPVCDVMAHSKRLSGRRQLWLEKEAPINSRIRIKIKRTEVLKFIPSVRFIFQVNQVFAFHKECIFHKMYPALSLDARLLRSETGCNAEWHLLHAVRVLVWCNPVKPCLDGCQLIAQLVDHLLKLIQAVRIRVGCG